MEDKTQILNLFSNKITPKEQEELLLKAAENEEFDNSLQTQTRNSFEKNGKIIPDKNNEFKAHNSRIVGYCKSRECKANYTKSIIHSVDFGNYVHYHCLECLSALLCQSRLDSKGPPILVHFEQSPANSPHRIDLKNQEIEVKVIGEKIHVNGIAVDAKFVPLTPNDNCDDAYMGWKLIVLSEMPVRIGTMKGYFSGTYKGYFKGRNLCKNIYLGKNCVSLKPDYKPQGFIAKSVPPGVPGWKEKHNPGLEGRIMITDHCPGCAQQNAYEQYKASKSSEGKSPWKNSTPIRKEEENEHKQIVADLLEEVEKLRTENASLRMELANKKANEIRQKMNMK